MKTKILVLNLLFLLINVVVYGADVTLTSRLQGSDFSSGAQISVIDQLYNQLDNTAPPSNFKDYEKYVKFTLGFDRAKALLSGTPNKVKVVMKAQVEGYRSFEDSGANSDMNPNLGVLPFELEIDFNSDLQAEKYIKRFSDFYGLDVEIIDVNILEFDGVNWTLASSLIEDLFYIELELHVERYNKFIYSSSPNVQIKDEPTNKGMEIYWNYLTSAESYELQWVYIDNYKQESNEYYTLEDLISESGIVGDDPFVMGGTKVELSDQRYYIPLIFPRGFVFVRARTIGVDHQSLARMEGRWSGYTYFEVTEDMAHEMEFNWQYSANYAEDGLRSDQIKYIDGSYRERQVVKRDNLSNQSLVGGSLYDYHGRPSLSIPMTPIESSSFDYNTNMALIESSNGVEEEYTWENFDKRLRYINCKPLVENVADPLSQNSNSEHYFSSNYQGGINNDLKPTSDGFNFSQTVYTEEPNSKILTQGTAQKIMQVGELHSTKNYYQKPTQIELMALFGAEAGNSNFYTKEYHRDNNGGLSIQIKDNEDRVIVSGLTGEAPENLEPLNVFRGDEEWVDLLSKLEYDGVDTEFDLNEFDFEEMEFVFDGLFLVTTPESDRIIRIGLNSDQDKLIMDYALETFTNLDNEIPDEETIDEYFLGEEFPIYYDLELNVFNECNELILQEHSSSIKSLDIATNLFELENLGVGEYRVKKKLTVVMDSLEAQVERFYDYIYDVSTTNNNNNFLELEDFNVDPDLIDCDTDCGRCNESLGPNDEITNDFLNCIQACGKDECEVISSIMLSDYQLGGLYTLEEYDPLSDESEVDKWGQSIFNPNYYITNGIELSELGIYDESGNLIETTEELANSWDDAWAFYFLPLHPSYCYYEDCLLSNPYWEINYNGQSIRYSSKYFDNTILTASLGDLSDVVFEDFDYVIEDGGLNEDMTINYLSGASMTINFMSNLDYFISEPNNVNSNNLLDVLLDLDPYFSSEPNLISDFRSEFIFDEGLQDPLNLIQYLKYSVLCSNWYGIDNNLCFDQRITQTDYGVMEHDLKKRFWEQFVILYTQTKKDFIRNQLFVNSDDICDIDAVDIIQGLNVDPSDYTGSLGLEQIEQLISNAYITETGYCPIVEDLNLFTNFILTNEFNDESIKVDLIPGYESVIYQLLTQLDPELNSFIEYEISVDEIQNENIIFAIIPSSQDMNEVDYKLTISNSLQNFNWENIIEVVDVYPGDVSTSMVEFQLKIKYNYTSNGNTTIIYDLLDCSLSDISSQADLSEFFECEQEEVVVFNPIAFEIQNTLNQIANAGLLNSSTNTSSFVADFNNNIESMNIDLDIFELSTIDIQSYNIDFNLVSGETITISIDLNSGGFNNLLSIFSFQLQGNSSEPNFMMECLTINGEQVMIEFTYTVAQSNLELTSNTLLPEGMSENICIAVSTESLGCEPGYQMYSNLLSTYYSDEELMSIEEFCMMDYSEVITAYNNLYQGSSTNELTPDFIDIYDFKIYQGVYFVDQYLNTGTTNDFLSFINENITNANICLSTPSGIDLINQEPFNPCEESNAAAIEFAQYEEMQMYLGYLEQKVSEFRLAFVKAVKATVENLDLWTKISDFEYTLYYYDQAGNLIKTVPPNGVKVLTVGEDNNNDIYDHNNINDYMYNYSEDNYVLEDESNVTDFYSGLNAAQEGWTPDHVLATKYKYNSLNNPVSQYTPDGGITKYYYDKAGRLILSQNAKQFAESTELGLNIYSYTLYDNLGRIIESGELKIESSPVLTSGNFLESGITAFKNWVYSGERSEITQTFYDMPEEIIPGITQSNLRGRIANVSYKDHQDDLNYSSSSHYSYDIHGNVKGLTQVLRPNSEHLIRKEIEYKYDLITGNVTEVSYQKDSPDQLYHRYYYDANNRLQEVETSTNGWHWVRQAKYFYYDHGPLARVELGENQVQGLDYAYTIHGWLKAINGTESDGGHDALSSFPLNLNMNFAEDAFALELGYYGRINHINIEGNDRNYTSDYKSVTSMNMFGFNTQSDFESQINCGASLFNGNIALKYSKLPIETNDESVLLSQYRYDELNRLVGMNGEYPSSPLSDTYQSAYYYDASGNIKNLYRKFGNIIIDAFDYSYNNQNNQLSELLETSEDLVYESHIIPDVDDIESPYTYSYDEIGNLVYDEEAEIEEIKWTLQGKVRSISREEGSDKPDVEFGYDPAGNRQLKIVKPKDHNGIVLPENHWEYEYYIRDATGNVMANYEIQKSSIFLSSPVKHLLKEQPIYGSDRLGVINYQPIGMKLVNSYMYDFASLLPITIVSWDLPGNSSIYQTGLINYELKDHLGNVMVTLKDNFKSQSSPGSQEVLLSSYQDYYPFGMIMSERHLNSGDNYRFGFNGQEKVDEISGLGNHTTATFWEYDTRIGRRWNQDPKPNTSISNYATFAGNPIWFNDAMGDTITVQGSDGTNITYKAGMKYEGDPFIEKTVNAYNDLYQNSDEAKKHIDNISTSESFYNVVESDASKFTPNDITNNITKESTGGGTIHWNSIGEAIPEQVNTGTIKSRLEIRPSISLIHESIHASRFDDNTDKAGFYKNIRVEELETTHIENVVRSEMNLPLRTHYNVGYLNGNPIGGTGFPLLRYSGGVISNFLWKTSKEKFKYYD